MDYCPAPTRPQAPRTGLVVVTADKCLVVSADTTARHVLQMEPEEVREAGKRINSKMLDSEGRPFLTGSRLPEMSLNVSRSDLHAIRFRRGATWVWFHMETLLLESGLGHCLVTAIPDGSQLPRQVGWTCSSCDEPTTGVAEYNGRDLCLSCWTKTQRFRISAA